MKSKEEGCKEREAECRKIEHLFGAQWKAREDACKDKEEEHKACKHQFNEWEHIQLNIRKRSDALSIESNELIKHEMQSDNIALINRKNFS